MKHSKNQISVIRITSIMGFLLAFTTSQAQNNLNVTFRPGENFPLKKDMTIDGVNATVDLNCFSAGMDVTWILWKTE